MLLKYLKDNGLEDNTIVIYGSDHGGYHTIHGLPEKAPGICSDAVCRVPMIWRVPGITPEGNVCNALVENTDITPSLLSLCDIPPMKTEDGLDITELLAGKETKIHNVAVTENPWSKSLRWGSWRIVHYQPEMFPGKDLGELYNIEDDPQEQKNLYDNSKYSDKVTEGRRLLLEWLIRTTRIVTSHPTCRTNITNTGGGGSGGMSEGKYSYPICGDGRAPSSIQPINNKSVSENYL